jgi:hypothetical protein
MDENTNANDFIKDIDSENNIENTNPNLQPKQGNKIIDILKSKTGQGSIDSYLDHPLNYNNSKSVGQILRGLTGFCGQLDLAIIDLAMGLISLFKGKATNV